MSDLREPSTKAEERTRQRQAQALMAEYHETQLSALLARVREGFERLDAGQSTRSNSTT
jgi:hypothetical protein